MASLADVVEPVLTRRHLELEELTQTRAGSRVVVGITIDGDGESGRGLTLDEVAEASRAISEALDETGVMGDRAYVLEVGTRGVDRPLTRPAQYRRNTGRLVELRLAASSVTGRIAGVSDDAVTLADGSVVPFSDIAKAVIQVEMNRADDEEE